MTDTKKQIETIRILISDDHAVVREGLRTLIGTEPGMEVIGEAADGFEAVQQACALRPARQPPRRSQRIQMKNLARIWSEPGRSTSIGARGMAPRKTS